MGKVSQADAQASKQMLLNEEKGLSKPENNRTDAAFRKDEYSSDQPSTLLHLSPTGSFTLSLEFQILRGLTKRFQSGNGFPTEMKRKVDNEIDRISPPS